MLAALCHRISAHEHRRSPRVARDEDGGYRQAMISEDRTNLERLSSRLRKEQAALLLAAAKSAGLPSNSTLQRVAQLELNIAAIENTLADPS